MQHANVLEVLKKRNKQDRTEVGWYNYKIGQRFFVNLNILLRVQN